MHRALASPSYRITPCDRSSPLRAKTHVLMPDGRPLTVTRRQGGEPFWTEQDLRVWVRSGAAGRLNARKFDLYVTPIDDDHHYILIDDMQGLGAVRELRRAGYRPALVQRSSAGNFQVVLKVRRFRGEALEQQAANLIVRKLNQQWGDPKLSAARRPFRLADFRNKKMDGATC